MDILEFYKIEKVAIWVFEIAVWVNAFAWLVFGDSYQATCVTLFSYGVAVGITVIELYMRFNQEGRPVRGETK